MNSRKLSKISKRIIGVSISNSDKWTRLLKGKSSLLSILIFVVSTNFIVFFFSYCCFDFIPHWLKFEIKRETAIILIEKRLANFAILFSISIVVLTFVLNLAEKNRYGKDVLATALEETYFFPILYFVLTLLFATGLVSFLQDTLPNQVFISLTCCLGIYFFLGLLFGLGVLFYRISYLLNTDFLYKRRLSRFILLGKESLYKSALADYFNKFYTETIRKTFPNNSFIVDLNSEIFIPKDVQIVDVEIDKLTRSLKKINRKYPNNEWEFKYDILATKFPQRILASSALLSSEDKSAFLNCFVFSGEKNNVEDVSFLNELYTIKDLIIDAVNRKDIKSVNELFEFYFTFFKKIGEEFLKLEKRYKKEEIFFNSWFDLVEEVYHSLDEILMECLSEDPSNEYLVNLVFSKVFESNFILLNIAIEQIKPQIFRNHAYIVYGIQSRLNQSQIFYPMISGQAIDYYCRILSGIGIQYGKINKGVSLERKFVDSFYPVTFFCLEKLVSNLVNSTEPNIKLISSAIRKIHSCHLPVECQNDIFNLKRKLNQITIQNDDDAFQKTKLEFDLKNLFYVMQKSIIQLIQTNFYRKLKNGSINSKTIKLLPDLHSENYQTSPLRLEKLFEDWGWIENNLEKLNGDVFQFIPYFKSDISLYFFIQLVLGKLNINQVKNEIQFESVISDNKNELENLIKQFSSQWEWWGAITTFTNKNSFDERLKLISSMITIIDKRVKIKRGDKIVKAAVDIKLLEKYKNNLLKGYNDNSPLFEIQSLFTKNENQKYINNIDGVSNVDFSKYEEKQKLLPERENQFFSFGPDFYSDGIDVGNNLSTKETHFFLKTIFEKSETKKISNPKDFVEKSSAELTNKGFIPNLLITNIHPNEFKKEKSIKMGTVSFSWREFDIPFHRLALTDFPDFIIICDFKKSFEKIQYTNPTLTGNLIEVEFEDLQLESFQRINKDFINKKIEEGTPKFNPSASDNISPEQELIKASIDLENWIDNVAKYKLNKEKLFQEIGLELFRKSIEYQKVNITTSIFLNFKIKNQNAFIIGKND